MAQHLMKDSCSVFHIHLPLKARLYVNMPGYLDRIRNKQLGKNQARKLLEDTLQLISTKEQVAVLKCDEAITAIQTEKQFLITEFEKTKTTLRHKYELVIAEIETHLYEDSYVSVNQFFNQLWNYRPESPIAPLSTHLDFAEDVMTRLTSFLATCNNIGNTLQPDLQEGKIIVFDSATETWKPPIDVHEAITVTYCSAFVWLPNNRLVICGGDPPLSPQVWSVEMSTGTVSCLPDMLEARRAHAAVYHNGTIYVFGGDTPCLNNSNTAEKLTFPEEHWNSLPNMLQGTACVTPCVHEGYVYLCGGKGGSSCQCFGLIDEQFSLLYLTLPKTECTYAFVEKDELIVMQSEILGRCQTAEHEQQFQFTQIEERYQKDYW